VNKDDIFNHIFSFKARFLIIELGGRGTAQNRKSSVRSERGSCGKEVSPRKILFRKKYSFLVK